MSAIRLDGLYFRMNDKNLLLIREEDEPKEGLEVIEDGLEVLQREMEF